MKTTTRRERERDLMAQTYALAHEAADKASELCSVPGDVVTHGEARELLKMLRAAAASAQALESLTRGCPAPVVGD